LGAGVALARVVAAAEAHADPGVATAAPVPTPKLSFRAYIIERTVETAPEACCRQEKSITVNSICKKYAVFAV